MILSTAAVDLGMVLKRLSDYDLENYKFSMDDFDDRLKLQKLIYILQSFGVYLGYDYSYYLRGPYCSNLAQTGYEVNIVYDDFVSVNEELFKDEEMEKKYKKSVKFIKELGDMKRWEIAASLHLLNNGLKLDRDECIKRVVNKKGISFTEEDCEKVWKKLKSKKLVKSL